MKNGHDAFMAVAVKPIAPSGQSSSIQRGNKSPTT
jgi:hypothetical protein